MSTDETHRNCLTTGNPFTGEIEKAKNIGVIAAAELERHSLFMVRGNTSRGLFLSLSDEVILFLSKESFFGPLTINLPATDVFDGVPVKSTGLIENQCLEFANQPLIVDCANARIWSALDIWNPDAISKDLPSRTQVLNMLNKIQSALDEPNELLSTVEVVMTSRSAGKQHDTTSIRSIITNIGLALHTYDLTALQVATFYLAGRGRGLTPSGDDFLMGIAYGMFMLQRLFSDFQVAAGELLSDLVKNRSTLISANILSAAKAGEVDERIGAMFAALLHPEQPAEDAIHGILSWGSSSGLDATAGMALLLASMPE